MHWIVRVLETVASVGRWAGITAPRAVAGAVEQGAHTFLRLVPTICGVLFAVFVWYASGCVAGMTGLPGAAFARYGLPFWFGWLARLFISVGGGLIVTAGVRGSLEEMFPGLRTSPPGGGGHGTP